MSQPIAYVAPIEQPDLSVRPDPTGPLEGAGVLSDAYDIAKAIDEGKPSVAGVDSAAGAIDAMGFVQDPVRGLLSAGVGWLIEHVEFLREPLDWLAGDPGQIKASAQTWHNVALNLSEIAGRRAAGVAEAADGWQGDAASSYLARTQRLTVPAIRSAGSAADDLATQTLGAASMIGTVRSTIRDAIANLVAALIPRALAALGLAVESAGASVALFVADAVTEAVQLATKITKLIRELLQRLASSATSLESLRGELRTVLGELREPVTDQLTAATGEVMDAAREAVSAEGPPLEAAKQVNDARETSAGWHRESPR
jgi:uncharacterized protein YukE